MSIYNYFSIYEKYSLEDLIKIDVNLPKYEGQNLLFFAIRYSKDKDFAERVIKAGIKLDYVDNNNLSIACHLAESSFLFEHCKLLYKHGAELQNLNLNNFHNVTVLDYLMMNFVINNKHDEDELVKTQIFLLENQPDIIRYQEKVLHNLSLLMPQSLQYLIDKGIPVFDITDILGNNILVQLFHYSTFNKIYKDETRLSSLLSMMTPKQVNHTNNRQENILWQIYEGNLDYVHLLKQYGLDMNHLNINGKGILETRCKNSEILTKFCIENGATLRNSVMDNFIKLSKEEFMYKYKWDSEHYQLMTPFIKQKKALEEKELIGKTISIVTDENNSLKRSRL